MNFGYLTGSLNTTTPTLKSKVRSRLYWWSRFIRYNTQQYLNWIHSSTWSVTKQLQKTIYQQHINGYYFNSISSMKKRSLKWKKNCLFETNQKLLILTQARVLSYQLFSWNSFEKPTVSCGWYGKALQQNKYRKDH